MTDVMEWDDRLKLSEKHEKDYLSRADGVIERYRDEKRKGHKTAPPKMNLLWSNTETIRPSMYSATPQPVARRRFRKDDPVAREGSKVLERNISFSIDNGVDDFDNFAESVITDYLLPGRSVDRVKHKPIEADGTVIFDEIAYHHVPYDKFRYDVQDRWKDVDWVAFGDHMFTKTELKKEFNLSAGQLTEVPFDNPINSDEEPSVQVWEIWDRKQKKVLWHVMGGKNLLRAEDPPVNLAGFYDIPEPLYSVRTNGTLIPIPEFTLYQYQADEVDKLTVRIQKITNTIRLNYVYAGDQENLLKNILTAGDGIGVGVSNWAAILERGGISGMIAYTPIDEAVKVVQTLIGLRQALIQQIFEITGIADILRGNTDPRETAKAQALKASFGSLRLVPRQRAVQRYFRNLFRLAGEIMVENFDRQTLESINGEKINDEALHLLRDDASRVFAIDIETDSTIAADEQQEKEDVAEFLGALTQFMPIAAQLTAAGGAEVGMGILLWAMRRFRVGKDIEGMLEQVAERARQAESQPQQPPPPDPKLVKVQGDLQIKQQQVKTEQEQEEREFRLEVMQALAEMKDERELTLAKVAKLESDVQKNRAA